MLFLAKRHPFAVKAHFARSLVLTYAFPAQFLRPLLPEGVVLDEFSGCGFLAIALVDTRGLRPAFLPSIFGQDFLLSGYRIFVRAGTGAQSLRGLYILRSDASRRRMVWSGNLLTHYKYEYSPATCIQQEDGALTWRVRTRSGEADLMVNVRLQEKVTHPPAGSPFPDLAVARRFAGPLPYTFDYERQTRSIIAVKGVRQQWNPRPVAIESSEIAFLRQAPFASFGPPRLANAFYLSDVDYAWEKGRRIPIG